MVRSITGKGDAGPASFGSKVGIFSDVHGENRTLVRALEHCQHEGVETIALLGDLFDLIEEADQCAAALAGWDVVGVYGNHEKEIALAASSGEIAVEEQTLQLLGGLRERIVIDDVCLIHEEERWGFHDPVAAMFERTGSSNGHRPAAWITFAGHTHVRSARTESGPLDISRKRVSLTTLRRYLITPATLAGLPGSVSSDSASSLGSLPVSSWIAIARGVESIMRVAA